MSFKAVQSPKSFEQSNVQCPMSNVRVTQVLGSAHGSERRQDEFSYAKQTLDIGLRRGQGVEYRPRRK